MGAYNLGRPGSLRRRLGIVHPASYFHLSKLIDANWAVLKPLLEASPYSITTPIADTSRGRAFSTKGQPKDFVPRKAALRAGHRYLVKADVSSFYSSIYTHSIPWAIHGKSTAKAHRGKGYFGNDIDRVMRNAQDGQTIGIPIGPDTSLVISELILASVDESLARMHTGLDGVRFMDDYELSVDTISEGEAVLASLQELLSNFELSLNPKKTQIVELPQPLEYTWTHDIRSFEFRAGSNQQASDLVRFFDIAFAHSRQNPEQPVIQYAMGRLAKQSLQPSTWDLLQSLIIQGFMAETGGAAVAWEILRKAYLSGYPPDKQMFEAALSRHIERHAPMGHSSEVAWALWIAIATRLDIGAQATQAVCQMDDSAVALLALDAKSLGLMHSGKFNTAKWEPYMTEASLHESHWLLSYEANVQNWLPTVDGGDHVAQDQTFQFLKNAGVHFYQLLDPLQGDDSTESSDDATDDRDSWY